MSDLYFSRDTKVYLEQDSNVWVLPILDGFSFSQATNASEITLNEMSTAAGVSRRARKTFNDSYAPAEWSFSLYARPIVATPAYATGWEPTVANHHSIEEPLWANFVAANDFGATTTDVWDSGVTPSTGSTVYDFDDSNVSELGTFTLYFALGDCSSATNQVYKITNCVTNSIGIDFDIDGIATLNFSGFGSIISDEGTTTPTATIDEGNADTDNFIRNRLTALTVQAGDDLAQGDPDGTGTYVLFPGAATNGTYSVVLTGGSINFENNITFLTPETLCTVNQPIGHVTGTRSISGSFTAYLSNAVGEGADLFDDLISATTVITNQFALNFDIGGTGNTPLVTINIPTASIEVPTHSIEDVISLEVNFNALASTMDQTDECTITYTGPA